MKGDRYRYTDAMSTLRVESVKCEDGYSNQHFTYSSCTSRTSSTSLPPVGGHLGRADNHTGRHVSKLPEWSRYNGGLQLSSSLPDCREMKLPELTEQSQMTTSRRPPPARAVATTQRAEDPRMKHWSSELPAYNRRSWRQSMDSISQTHRAVAAWSENGNRQSETSYQHPSIGTTLRKSSSTEVSLIDIPMTPMIAKKASLSMSNLTDKQPMVIIILSL